MKRVLCLGMLVLMSMVWASPLLAHAPIGGLTVAVSPDGKTIVAGGDNRVLYVLDAASLEVKQRVWLKTTIWGLYFNKDGSKLLVEDTSNTLYFVETTSWKLEREMKNNGFLSAARNIDLCATRSSNTEISFLSMTDGSLKGKANLSQRVATFALNPDGTKLAVMTAEEKDESEPTVKYGDIPKDLKGAARSEFEQKNNGKTAMFSIFEVPSGQELSSTKTFFTTTESSRMLFDGDAVMVVGYSNQNAIIPPEGEITIFELLNSYNYGLGISVDQKYVAAGGLAKGTYMKVEGMAMLSYDIDRLPGWPEYFKSFEFDAEGNAYGTTSAFRLFKITPDGTIATSAPLS